MTSFSLGKIEQHFMDFLSKVKMKVRVIISYKKKFVFKPLQHKTLLIVCGMFIGLERKFKGRTCSLSQRKQEAFTRRIPFQGSESCSYTVRKIISSQTLFWIIKSIKKLQYHGREKRATLWIYTHIDSQIVSDYKERGIRFFFLFQKAHPLQFSMGRIERHFWMRLVVMAMGRSRKLSEHALNAFSLCFSESKKKNSFLPIYKDHFYIVYRGVQTLVLLSIN